MLRPKWLSSFVYMPKIMIYITSKKINLSSKKLSLDAKKSLKIKNLSLKFKKQYWPSFNLEYLRFIRLKKKRKIIVIIAITRKTAGLKKALL